MTAIWSLALSLLVLGPLLAPGYLLLRDAVSTPRSYLTDSAWGITDAAARAVPQDALLAVLSTVVDGGLIVKAIVLTSLWLSGWGAAAMVRTLLPTAPLPALLVAATVAIWNPYVAERLLQGHWSLLAGYAALPWTVVGAVALRRRSTWWPLCVALPAAALTPTGALLAAVLALVLIAAPGGLRRGAAPGGVRRGARIVGTAVLAAVASAPWLVATAVSGGGVDSADPAGVLAFAARAEPGLGTIGSLAGLGGIWNSDAVPASRGSLFALFGTAILLAVVALGAPALWRRRRNPVIVALAVTAGLAILLPTLGATPIGSDLGMWLAVHIPGAGLLRDSQKWVALAMPFYALAAAAGTCWATNRVGNATLPATASILALMVALPDLGWGVGAALRPVQYPASWGAVAAELDGGSGDVAVLPAGMFRIFPYSGDAPVLDPAPRMLPLDVLQTGELIVAGGTVTGEGTRATEVENALTAGESADTLRTLGVGWVLVEKTTPGQLGDSAATLAQLEPAFEDDELALYRVSDPVESESTTRWPVIVAHLMWSVLLLGGLAVGAVRKLRSRPRES